MKYNTVEFNHLNLIICKKKLIGEFFYCEIFACLKMMSNHIYILKGHLFAFYKISFSILNTVFFHGKSKPAVIVDNI